MTTNEKPTDDGKGEGRVIDGVRGICCSRCGVDLTALAEASTFTMTVGFYDVRRGSSWHHMAINTKELFVCDACMHSSKRYQKVYGRAALDMPTTIGGFIANRRKRENLSQVALGRMIGRSRPVILGIEGESRNLLFSEAVLLSMALGFDLADLAKMVPGEGSKEVRP